MKKIIPLIILVTLFFNNCSINTSIPIEPFPDNLDGIWKSSIIEDDQFRDKGLEYEFIIGGSNLEFIVRNYYRDTNNISDPWHLNPGMDQNHFRFTIDNNFLILADEDLGRNILFRTLHYSLTNNKFSISSAQILQGNSNSLTNTEWEDQLSYYQYGKFESFRIKEIYNENNTGKMIMTDLIRNRTDSTNFIYFLNDNEITISTQSPAKTYNYIFEINNNKMYKYLKSGANNDLESYEFENLEFTKQQPVPANLFLDYLPLEIGKSWLYAFSYIVPQYNFTEKGNIKWTIIEVQNTIYTVQEIYNGIRINLYSGMDTTYFGPDTINFQIDQNDYMISFESSFLKSGKVRFNRYYANEADSLLLFFHSVNGISQDILLKKDKGIVKWSFGGTHNSESFGVLKLVE